MQICAIDKNTPGLPRNFALVAGRDYAEMLVNMVGALAADPAVNLVVWNPEKPSLIAEKQAMRFADAVMARNVEKDGIWASDKTMFDSLIDTPLRKEPVASCLSDHFNDMAAYTGDRVGPRNFEQWQERSFRLLAAIREVFPVSRMNWSSRALQAKLFSDFHVDNGTNDRSVRLLHQLGGPGTFYVADRDVVQVGQAGKITFADHFNTVWAPLPGAIAMIAGRETARCVVHSEPFVPKGETRPNRCVEIVDFTLPRGDIYSAAGLPRPGS